MVDASQEMITLGLCNIFGSFVQAMPTCGAFTRSAVSHSSGVRTPLTGLYSGKITASLMRIIFLTRLNIFVHRHPDNFSIDVFDAIFLLYTSCGSLGGPDQCCHLHDRLPDIETTLEI